MVGQDTKQWQGYVCPSCRLLFKAPISLMGGVAVCPSCAMPINLPTAEEAITPLFTENKKLGEKGMYDAVVKRDRTLPDWEAQSAVEQDSHSEQGNMWYWLIPLAVLGCGIVAVLFSLLAEDGEPRRVAVVAPAAMPDKEEPAKSSEISVDTPINEEKVSELVRLYTEASSLSDLVKIVRDEGGVKEKLDDYYRDGWKKPSGYLGIRSIQRMYDKPHVIIAECESEGGMLEKLPVVELSNGELRLDWEAMVGYTPSWEKLRKEKPVEPITLRVFSEVNHFYNYGFNDEEWQAFALTHPMQDAILTGYAKRNGSLASKLQPIGSANGKLPFLVKVRYPDDPQSPNQVIIEDVVAAGWILPITNDSKSEQ